jgi:hypothetical protein
MKTIAPPLRAGTQTGSLINHVISGSIMESPKVGMGCTIICWTDRRAATITEVSPSGKLVGIVQDVATAKFKGMTDQQDYEYAPGTGKPTYYTLRKNGAWVRQGERIRGQRIVIGQRNEYHDFSF